MKRLTIYFSTIFILATSPALALISFNPQNNMNSALYTTQSTHMIDLSEYDELRNDVTSCVTKNKSKKTPENYITNRTGELKSNKLTRPIKYDTQIRLSNNDLNPNTWGCSINAQPNDKITEKIKLNKIGHHTIMTNRETITAKCLDEITRLAAIDDWYVSECLSNRIKKKYNIETVDDYYTKIYQFYNKPESESTNTESQQTDNTNQPTPPANINNNSASSKISVTVSDYYNNTGIKNITVCNNNNCKQSDKNGKVTFTATTPQNIRIQGASEYHCENPEEIIQSAMADLDVVLIEGISRRPTGIENSQHQFVIKCRKLCTDEDLQKLNSGLKEQNKIKKCFKKNKREYEITECKYPESKLNNNQCKLYSNDITITGKGIDINKVEISLGKNKSKFKPAAEKDANGQTITIKDIDLDETKYISAKHGNQTIACEFKFPNKTRCDFGSLNDKIIKEDVSPGTSNTSAENNDAQQQIQNKEQTEGNDSSGTPNSSELDNKPNNTESKNNQQETPNEKQANEEQITEEEYEKIESEIKKILTDIEKEIESQCPSRKTDQKCKNKNKIIKQIDEAAKKTLKELNGAWK